MKSHGAAGAKSKLAEKMAAMSKNATLEAFFICSYFMLSCTKFYFSAVQIL